MDNKQANNTKNFLSSSYRRTLLILFIAIIALAIPLTLTLLSRQQDIRQRAEETEEIFDISSRESLGLTRCEKDRSSSCSAGFTCTTGEEKEEGICLPSDLATNPMPSCLPRLSCSGDRSCRDLKGLYKLLRDLRGVPWCPEGVSPTCIPRPACLDATPKCLLPETGWCPVAPTRTPTATPTAALSPTPTLIPFTPEVLKLLDLNDDGKIDEPDLNILLKSFERRFGD